MAQQPKSGQQNEEMFSPLRMLERAKKLLREGRMPPLREFLQSVQSLSQKHKPRE